MKGPRDWRPLWRRLLSWKQLEADIDDEVFFHIEAQVEAMMEAGVPEKEARRRARLRFGSENRIRAEMAAASRSRIKREKRGVTMDSIIRDLKYSVRQLARYPGFSFLLILTIAVAIGGNVAIFSVLEGIVLRPLPYPEADRLVAVWESQGMRRTYQPFTGPDYRDVRAQIRSLEEFGVATARWANFSGGDRPQRIRGGYSSASLMDLLGVRPLHGRLFTEEEEVEGRERVVVLSYGLWQDQFGGDPGVVGSSINMDGAPREVIGIMPESFRFPTAWGGRDDTRFFAPLVIPTGPEDRGMHWLGGIARMAPDVTVEEVEAELSVIASELAEAYPDTNARTHMWIQPMMARTLGGIASTVVFLLIIVGLVLLIACGNVASMLLARGMNRASEFAIRASMGAGKKGLVRQLLTESFVMALVGGAVGILIAFWGVDALKAVLPESIPRAHLIQVNLRVLGHASFITIVTGLMAGMAPALFAARTNLAETIKHGRASRGGTRSRFLSGMIVAQLAVGFVLVNSAIVLAVSYRNVMKQPTNFATEEAVVTGVSLAGPAYDTPLKRRTFYLDLLERVRGFPGVTEAGITSKLPLRGGSNSGVMVRDQVYDPQADFGLVEFSFAGDGYLEAMGIGILSGRTLDRRDMEIASVMAEDSDAMIELPVVINRAMAEEFWPESEALGELVRPASAHEYFRARVVGIVENVRQWGPDQDPLPEMYFPHTAELWGAISAQLIIRAGTDPEALVPLVRAAVDELDSTLPLAASITMAKILKDSTGGRRFSMLLVSLFAVTALLLIIAGTYGVVSYSVSQRTHEIGVRMTLGANKGRVARQFLRQVGALMGFGLALGILGALVVSQIIRSMVYGISAINPLQMSLAASVMVLVALAATAGPVLRATGVDPLEAMRAD